MVRGWSLFPLVLRYQWPTGLDQPANHPTSKQVQKHFFSLRNIFFFEKEGWNYPIKFNLFILHQTEI